MRTEDITDRLRRLYAQNGTDYVQEAADTIDRLRAEVARLQAGRAAAMEEAARIVETVPVDTFACDPYIRQSRQQRIDTAAAIRAEAAKLKEQT